MLCVEVAHPTHSNSKGTFLGSADQGPRLSRQCGAQGMALADNADSFRLRRLARAMQTPL